MLRQAARVLLSLMLLASLIACGWSVVQIARNPALQPLVERTGDQIEAATDRWLARNASEALLTARLEALLAEERRNWLAIEAVEAVAAEQQITLPDSYLQARRDAYDIDSGWLATSGACLACAVNAANCELSGILICQAPMILTPLGDVAGISVESYHWAVGNDVDQLNLAFSAVGLAAEVLVVASGGSSLLVKGGASIGKLALKMKLLSPRLSALLLDAARRGIDWERLPWFPGVEDLKAAVRPEVIGPVVEVATQIGRIGGKLSLPESLHLLRYIDSSFEARAMATAAETLGPRTVGRLELMGKSRFLRATLRASDTMLALGWGFLGLVWSLAGLISGAVHAAAMRSARRELKKPRPLPNRR